MPSNKLLNGTPITDDDPLQVQAMGTAGLPTALGQQAAAASTSVTLAADGYGALETVTLTVDTTGSAGSATGTVVSDALYGFLLDVFFAFNAGAAATTDTTLLYEDPSNGQIIALTDTKTSGFYFPRKQCSDATGAAITGLYDVYPLNGTLRVNVAQCDALTGAVVVRLRYLRTA